MPSRVVLRGGGLAELLDLLLEILAQPFGLEASRDAGAQKAIHGIAGLIVEQRIVEDEAHEAEKLLAGLEFAGLELVLDGGEVHRVFDDVEIVGDAERFGVDGLQKGVGVVVVLEREWRKERETMRRVRRV